MRGSMGSADTSTLAVLSRMVQQQASMLAFIDMFRLLGVLFLVMIPFVFIMLRPKSGQAAAVVAE
jgi:DHA2 family multidrug resistance protein